MSTILEQIRGSVIEGNAKAAEAQVKQALDSGEKPDVVLNSALIPAMSEVGQKFEDGEYFVPEMLIAARAMQAGLKLLKPLLAASGAQPVGKVAIGTVKGDLHDIGKSLVAMMLEGAGFEIMDLGVDVTPEKFVAAVNQGANVVAMSALLTTTMPNMQNTIKALTDAGLRSKVHVMVGGAPVTEAYAKQIGADGYAPDASAAVRKAKELLAG
ncbi:MAG: cobalamin-binding protein [Chloroflexi bacterium]|nr:MAG: cobalamin-binding protein [Chloroflexota bacterium]